MKQCQICTWDNRSHLAFCTTCREYFCNNRTDELEQSHIIQHSLETNHNSFSFLPIGFQREIKTVCQQCGLQKQLKFIFLCQTEHNYFIACDECIQQQKFMTLKFKSECVVIDECINQKLIPHITTLEDPESRGNKKKMIQILSQSRSFIIIPSNLQTSFQNLICVDGKQALYYQLQKEIIQGSIVYDEQKNQVQECARSLTVGNKTPTYTQYFLPALTLETQLQTILQKGRTCRDCYFGYSRKEVIFIVLDIPKHLYIHNYFYLLKITTSNKKQVSVTMKCWEKKTNGVVFHLQLAQLGNFAQTLMQEPNIENDMFTNYKVVSCEKLGNFEICDIDSLQLSRFEEALNVERVDKSMLNTILYAKDNQQSGINNDIIQNQYNNLVKYIQNSNLPIPDQSQKNAIINALQLKIGIIDGCYGGGKSLMLSYLAYIFQQLGKRILICAQTNNACDSIAQKCQQLNLNFLRVPCMTLVMKDIYDDNVDDLNSFSKHLKEESKNNVELQQLFQDFQDEEQIDTKLLRQVSQEIFRNFSIIISTLSNSGDSRLKNEKFDILLMDEACQATEPEAMVGINHHVQHIVMCGDIHQLGPQIRNGYARKCGLGRSLFERLQQNGIMGIALDHQYRMSEPLMQLTNEIFYQSRLKCGIQYKKEAFPQSFLDQVIGDERIAFLNVEQSVEMYSQEHCSISNQANAECVEKLFVGLLTLWNVKQQQITILTPYAAQRELIHDLDIRMDVRTIDSFQGQEKDYIIFDTVRSGEAGAGFLNDEKRLNVALSRAKKCLIVLGNEVAMRGGVGQRVYQWFMERGLVRKVK